MTKNLLLLFLCLATLTVCKTTQAQNAATLKPGMFKVAILYPSGDDKTFDMDYYEKNHMPMMAGFIGKNLVFYEIDKGLSGRGPNDKVPFVAVGYFYIKDITEYNKTISQNINTILPDIKKYTNIQPVVQISEIKQIVTGQ